MKTKKPIQLKKQNEKDWQDRKVKMRIAMPRSSIKRKRESYKKDSYQNKKDANMSIVSDDLDSSSTSSSSTEYTVKLLSRATNKTKNTLPTSPRKKVAALSKLVHGLSSKSKNLVFKASQHSMHDMTGSPNVQPRQQQVELLPFLKDLTCHIVNLIIKRQYIMEKI